MSNSILASIEAKRAELTIQAGHLESSASAAAGNFTSLLVDDLNEEVRQVYETQQLLERESRLLKAELAALTQQLAGWSATTQQLLEALKHVGDIEHYVGVLSREAAALAKVLTAAAEAGPVQAGPVSSSDLAKHSIPEPTELDETAAVSHVLASQAAALALQDSVSADVTPSTSTSQLGTEASELPVSVRASR